MIEIHISDESDRVETEMDSEGITHFATRSRNLDVKINLDALMPKEAQDGVNAEKPSVSFMTRCPYCGNPNIAITGNEVAKDYELGEIIQQRTCEACGKKHYVRLMYRLIDVVPVNEEELPKG